MTRTGDETLNCVFSALADPTRRAILKQLARGQSEVSELARPFNISLPAVSRHLRILEEAGLVTRKRDGRYHRIHLAGKSLKEAAAWLDHYRGFWESRLESLQSFIQKTKS
jgi:DNA-binding transcriptional ArsR family regulator